ncbi:hypothetical protein FDI21_gp180 [Pseudomonas phage Noxifer]|uniref:Holin n=1 Tax=Pseudomonas phage Noxifer TaxID=2006684 RepID=A0A1Y0T0N3_9CAUD|nr:hypothetical protein FDI21_gp180 [Pseudomonas phage Noxifer]ARV77349.1 hypothetical protein NOXIFER_180 [Pseudomonas phage Noxifer]
MNVSNIVKTAAIGVAVGAVVIGVGRLINGVGTYLGEAAALGIAANAVDSQIDQLVADAREAGDENWRAAAHMAFDQLWSTMSAGVPKNKAYKQVTAALTKRFEKQLSSITDKE